MEIINLIRQLANSKENTLKFTRQALSILPPEIGQIFSLTQLDLYNNKLSTLPPEIGRLCNLHDLDLSFNELNLLPPEIGVLNNLSWLNLSFNNLTSLPSEIGQLTSLHHLDISNNKITSLPNEILNLVNLTYLDLRDNLLPIPPEILEKVYEPGTIINYYLQVKNSTINQNYRALNEAKMVVVGQASVGKTSLVKRLLHNSYDLYEPKTNGIKIQPWYIQMNEQDIRLNIWDFGGQEIMHATHQFFLTKRSLYLLVLDNRLGELENRIEYWLNIIQSFGGDSPVIIVGNKVDQHPLDLNKSGLQKKYKNIKAIVETSCQTKLGLDKLKTVIIKEIGELEHIQDQLPQIWFSIKEKLENMKQDFISYPEYQDICKAQKIHDNPSHSTLIGFLNDLGIVLNFQEPFRQENTNILNPEWVTNGVYKIINDNELMTQHKGILSIEMLSRILDEQRYPKEKHLLIIDIMRKFKLCFYLEGFRDKKFLIPDLLPKEEPYTGEWEDALAFEYHYKFLPCNVISRFIVSMNDKIYKQTYWRSGVVLADVRNKALVKADREDKKIFIKVIGSKQTRRIFLYLIRNQFQAIHKTIPGLKVEDKVTLPEHPDIVVDYEHLLTLEEKGVTRFIPQGYKEYVDVRKLLNGIETEVETELEKKQRWGHEYIFLRKDEQPLNVSVTVNNNNTQENKNRMTEITQNHYGSGHNNAGKEFTAITTQINNSQHLAQAAKDIKQLLAQLSSDYNPNSPAQQAILGAKVVEQIEQDPTLRDRVINALKEAGTTALEEAISHPAAKIVIAGAKGFMEA